jgi:predicted transcriptional regulator
MLKSENNNSVIMWCGMKKINTFLIILIASLASLIALTVIGYTAFTAAQSTPQSNWVGDMWSSMGGMMGGQGANNVPATTVQNPVPAYFGVAFVALVGVTIFGVGGLAYFAAFPEIRKGAAAKTETAVAQASQSTVAPINAYDSVIKTLNDEERKVVEVLNTHDGKYLQKYIRKEAGLSRLKTHRIIARLAERGIVSLEKTGNTNRVFLENWLKQ